MTLIEIMVAMAVLGAVMSAAMMIFIPSLQRFEKADTDFDTQRNALIAVQAMVADLREARLGLLSMRTSPSFVMAVPSPRDMGGAFKKNADGTPAFSSWVVYWLVSEGGASTRYQLRRTVFAANPTPARAAWLPADSQLGPRLGRLVAGALESVAVTAVVTPSGLGRVRVEVKTSRVLQTHPSTFEGGATVDIPY